MVVGQEKFASGSFGEKFKSGHFIRTENARFVIVCKLLKELPAKSGFPCGGSCADDVKTWTEELVKVDVGETCFAIGVIFQIVDCGFDGISEIRGKF